MAVFSGENSKVRTSNAGGVVFSLEGRTCVKKKGIRARIGVAPFFYEGNKGLTFPNITV